MSPLYFLGISPPPLCHSKGINVFVKEKSVGFEGVICSLGVQPGTAAGDACLAWPLQLL